VYIDYNGDGDYIDGNELAYSYHDTLGLNTIPFGTITPPLLADTGMTGMRVIIEEGDAVPSPCGLYQFGETEDYTVHIVEASTCQDPPEPEQLLQFLHQFAPVLCPLQFHFRSQTIQTEQDKRINGAIS
jgi:hypothetical protein